MNKEKKEQKTDEWLLLNKNDFVSYWKPKEEGEFIEGVVVIKTFDDNDSLFVVVECADNKRFALPNHSVIDRVLKSSSINPGDRLRVVFLGSKERPGKRPFYDYDLFVMSGGVDC